MKIMRRLIAAAAAVLLITGAGMPIGFTAAAAGLGGYMGGRAIDMLETRILRRAGFVPDRRTGFSTRPAPLDERAR